MFVCLMYVQRILDVCVACLVSVLVLGTCVGSFGHVCVCVESIWCVVGVWKRLCVCLCGGGPLTILLAQARDELLGRDDAHLLLLRGDAVEEVGQAREQVLLLLLLGLVGQHVLPKRPAEVEGLQHRVTVTRVPKLREGKTKTKGRKRGGDLEREGESA